MFQPNPNLEVAVIFRQGMSVQVPPFEVPVRRREDGETYEQTALKLSREVGIDATVSHSLHVPNTDREYERPPLLYLMNDRTSGVTTEKSDFMVPAGELPSAVIDHPYFTDTEKALFWAVIRKLEYSSL